MRAILQIADAHRPQKHVTVARACLMESKGSRPIIANKTEKELREFVTRQLEKREDFYHQAQYIVKGKNLNIDELSLFVKENVG